MSIIHEALKKAAQDETPGQKSEGARILRVSSISSFRQKDLLIQAGIVVLIIGIVSLVYFERNLINLKYRPGRFQPASDPSTSVPLASITEPSVGPAPTPKSVLAPHPDDQPAAASHEGLGLKYLGDGKLEEAKQEFLSAASVDPASSTIQNDLGLVLKMQGHEDEAEPHYQAALQMDPKNVQAMNNLGLLYEQQNRLDEAKRLYQEAIRIQPSFPDPHLNYAVLLERAGFLEESKRHFQSFLSYATPHDEKAVQLVKKHLERFQ